MIKERLAKLIDVKSIVTITLVVTLVIIILKLDINNIFQLFDLRNVSAWFFLWVKKIRRRWQVKIVNGIVRYCNSKDNSCC